MNVEIEYAPSLNCSVCGTETVRLNYYTDMCHMDNVGVNSKEENARLRACPRCGNVKVIFDKE